MKKIVSVFGQDNAINRALNARAKEYAVQKGLDYVWTPLTPYTQEAAIAALREADAGIIDVEPYDRRIFSQICERNKLLVRFGVGFDAVNLADATEYGVKIARTQGANAQGVAEYALLLMMALRRKLMAGDAGVHRGDWSKEVGHETAGATVGILGFGAIGQTLARLLKGFGCKILAYDTYHADEAAQALGVEFADIDTIFTQCDAISVHLALNEHTRGIVNEDKLRKMKPDAVIVNTSRGPVIDDAAMKKALREHWIAGAALDVFSQEPLPVEDDYLKLDNLIVSPHAASSTVESLWQIYAAAIDIAANFLEGKEDRRMLN